MDKFLSIFTTYPVLDTVLGLAFGSLLTGIFAYIRYRKSLNDGMPYIQVCPLNKRTEMPFYDKPIDSMAAVFELRFRKHHIGDKESIGSIDSLWFREINKGRLAEIVEEEPVALLVFQRLEINELIIDHLIDKNGEFKKISKSVSENNKWCLFCKKEELPKMFQCEWDGHKLYYHFDDNRKNERYNIKAKRKGI